MGAGGAIGGKFYGAEMSSHQNDERIITRFTSPLRVSIAKYRCRLPALYI